MSTLLAVNEHPIERVARVVVGLALVWLAWSGTIGIWGYIGIVPVLTGAVGSCPLYSVFGFSTCPIRR
ncbi:MAG: DUF2892 domain-containing protein [Vicinamibacterales bacterium]